MAMLAFKRCSCNLQSANLIFHDWNVAFQYMLNLLSGVISCDKGVGSSTMGK